MTENDVVIIGGGPAGLAAAVKLSENGIQNILVLEREKSLGGILRQCIHDGFGLSRFNESLSGPEYAQIFIDDMVNRNIPFKTNSSVIDLSVDTEKNKRIVTFISPAGLEKIEARAVIFAMGCRERPHGALQIPGERPSGIFTAGVAQAFMNLHNRKVGQEIIILGSGDIGLIMARRMALEGCHVKGVYEILDAPNGLPRNIRQCLDDYNIPLHLSHTVTNIRGASRLSGVTVQKVDKNLMPIPGTECDLDCDTLILSVGLIPENELSQNCGVILDERTRGAIVTENFETNISGCFSAGNVLHVHDLVDFVSMEAEKLADSVTEYVKQGFLPKCDINVKYGSHINHVLPHKISGSRDVVLSMRVSRAMSDCIISVKQDGCLLTEKKIKNALPAEMIHITVKVSKLSGHGDIVVDACGVEKNSSQGG